MELKQNTDNWNIKDLFNEKMGNLMRCSLILLSTIVIIFHNEIAMAVPGQVIIIRHGEKPASGPGLSPAGKARAVSLVNYFTQTSKLLKFGVPAAIYATPPLHEDSSTRPVDTVKPTADKLELTIITKYEREKKKDIGKHVISSQSDMAKEILNSPDYSNKNVVICWEHNTIPDLIISLRGPDIGKWGSEFNRTVVLTYNDDGTVELPIQNLRQPF